MVPNARAHASWNLYLTALDIKAHDSAAHVRVTASFNADGHEPWITAGVSSDFNQAALMAIMDGFHYWLLVSSEEQRTAASMRGEEYAM